jgi:hypothetical protein
VACIDACVVGGRRNVQTMRWSLKSDARHRMEMILEARPFFGLYLILETISPVVRNICEILHCILFGYFVLIA